MIRLKKLKEQDLLDESHFPVLVVFNDQYKEDFLDTVVRYVSKGQRLAASYGAAVFPGDLDEYDIATGGTFEGVEVGLHSGDDILLDYKTFYYYLKMVCDRYLEEFPNDREAMEAALAEFRARYQLQE